MLGCAGAPVQQRGMKFERLEVRRELIGQLQNSQQFISPDVDPPQAIPMRAEIRVSLAFVRDNLFANIASGDDLLDVMLFRRFRLHEAYFPNRMLLPVRLVAIAGTRITQD